MKCANHRLLNDTHYWSMYIPVHHLSSSIHDARRQFNAGSVEAHSVSAIVFTFQGIFFSRKITIVVVVRNSHSPCVFPRVINIGVINFKTLIGFSLHGCSGGTDFCIKVVTVGHSTSAPLHARGSAAAGGGVGI